MHQRVAVDEALAEAGDDGTVHVYGAPELPPRTSIERMCTDQPKGERVLFHRHAISLTSGGFFCPTCGKNSGVIDGTA